MESRFNNFSERRTMPLVLILIITFLLYTKSLKYGFTSMDEQWMIVNDVSFLSKWSSVKNAFTKPSTDMYYRPLFMVSLIFDYHFGKLSPAIYHLSNLMWHLLAVLLLYRFLILMKVGNKSSFIYVLLFSIHPILIQAVAWIPGRNDIMLCVFILCSLIYLVKFIITSKKKFLLLNFLFFILSLFTKESAITLPIIFIAFHFVLKNKEKRKLILPTIAWFSIGVSWFLIHFYVISVPFNPLWSFTGVVHNVFNGLLLFVGKLIFPFQQSVMPTVKNASLISGFITSSIIFFLIFKPGLKNKSIAWLGLFIFFGLLILPVLFGALKSGNEHYEQRIYGPMIGVILFFSQLKFNTNSKVFAFFAGIFILFFLIKTSLRMNIYKDELSFMNAGINECPDNYLFYLQKADFLNNKKNDAKESIIYYDKSIALRPLYAQSYNNRGSAYLKLKKYKEAINDFTKATEQPGFNKLYYLNRCHAYFESGSIESAMKDLIVLKKCCSEIIQPDFEKSITDKWIFRMENLKKQLSLEKTNPELYNKIGTMYFDIEMKEEGLRFLNQAIRLDPNNVHYKKQLQEYKM